MPKILAKLKQGHTNRGAKCRWGTLNACAVAENWRLPTWSVVNSIQSQVYHTERSPLFAVCSLWCSASCGAGLSATADPCTAVAVMVSRFVIIIQKPAKYTFRAIRHLTAILW